MSKSESPIVVVADVTFSIMSFGKRQKHNAHYHHSTLSVGNGTGEKKNGTDDDDDEMIVLGLIFE